MTNYGPRRTEPMPNPMPDWLAVVVCEEANKHNKGCNFWEIRDVDRRRVLQTLARVLWEAGALPPVDPDEAWLERIARALGYPVSKGGFHEPYWAAALAELRKGRDGV